MEGRTSCATNPVSGEVHNYTETFSFWQKWAYILGLGITGFGLLMAFFGGTAVFDIFNSQINPAFWGLNVLDESARHFQQWVYGVLGATMAGWGVFVAFIAGYPFRMKEKWSRNCLAVGLLLWYSVDTSISLYFGVLFNAVFNTVILVLGLLPVVFTWKHFAK